MKNFITLLIICSLLLTGCANQDANRVTLTESKNDIEIETSEEVYVEPTNTTCVNISTPEPTPSIEPTYTPMPTYEPNYKPTPFNTDMYILEQSFGFYKGSVDMSYIGSITFSRTAPDVYDECWNANVANTEHVKGYRIGKEVVIVGDLIYANPMCSYMFAAYNKYGDSLWANLIEINGLRLIDTSYAESMKMMFAFTKLYEINGIDEWDVSNVRTFAAMFQGNDNAGDINLRYLDVGKWDTSSAENMSHMFYGCSQIEYIPVENWDVSNVRTFSHMFADCYNLRNIDFSKWNTSSATVFDAFLNDCRSLTVVDVSSFDTSNSVQFSQMFEYCYNLEHIIGLETWDVSNASYYAFSETFHGCHNLKEINIGSWVTTPDNTARMFKDCYSIVEIDLSGFDMSNNTHTTEMFMNCHSLINVINAP